MSTAIAETSESIGSGERPASAEIIAVIAAAAVALLGSGARIRSIESSERPDEQLSRWTRLGRTSVQASHNLKRKR